MTKSSNKKEIFNYLQSFCISFFITITVVLVLCQLCFFKTSFMLGTLEKSGFYKSIAQEVNNNLSYSAGAAGIEPSIFEHYINEKSIGVDIENYVTLLEKENVDKFQSNFSENMEKYLLVQGYEENDVKTEQVKKYIKIQEEDYMKHIKIPFAKYYFDAKDMLNFTFPYLLMGSGTFLIISLILSFKAMVKRGISKWIGFSLCGSGLMLGIAPTIILCFQWVEKINIRPQYYYEFVTRLVNDALLLLIIIGFLIFGLGVLLLLIYQKEVSKNLLLENR